MKNYRFEWDVNKAKSNLNKHHISFEHATSVFRDGNAITIYDEEHSEEEERYITIGVDTITRVLVVIHTFIAVYENDYNIRIISARKATKKEQKAYKEG